MQSLEFLTLHKPEKTKKKENIVIVMEKYENIFSL